MHVARARERCSGGVGDCWGAVVSRFFADSLLGVPTVRVHVPSRVFAKGGEVRVYSGEGHPAHPVSPAAGLSSLPAAGRAPGEGPSLHAPRIWID